MTTPNQYAPEPIVFEAPETITIEAPVSEAIARLSQIDMTDPLRRPIARIEGDVAHIQMLASLKPEWDAADPNAPDPTLPDRIRGECRRRIYAEIDQHAQANLTAAMSAGLLVGADADAFRAGLQWIAAMRAKCAELIDDQDSDFAQDAKWPAIPAEAAALAAAY